jgi:RNA 2',3'-cyclic 3'-phosphodiesterase
MSKRLFSAIELPATVRRSLHDLDPSIGGMNWMQLDQMHLTLGFFGNVDTDREEKLREHLQKIEFGSFFLPLSGVGSFKSRGDPSVVWIGTGKGHPHLFQLHKQVSEAALAAGIEPDLRPWHPHITLARCRGVSAQAVRKFVRENEELDGGMFPVDHFTLYSSQLSSAGSVYNSELIVPSRPPRSA